MEKGIVFSIVQHSWALHGHFIKIFLKSFLVYYNQQFFFWTGYSVLLLNQLELLFNIIILYHITLKVCIPSSLPPTLSQLTSVLSDYNHFVYKKDVFFFFFLNICLLDYSDSFGFGTL